MIPVCAKLKKQDVRFTEKYEALAYSDIFKYSYRGNR